MSLAVLGEVRVETSNCMLLFVLDVRLEMSDCISLVVPEEDSR